VDGFHIKDK